MEVDGVEQDHSSHSDQEKVAEAWAEKFASDTMGPKITQLTSIFNSEPRFKLKELKELKELKTVAMEAYLWSYNVNTGFFGHDFHPFMSPFDAEFNPQEMQREARSGSKVQTKEKERIVMSVGLGLRSSVARGPNDKPEEVLQVQVPVVTMYDL